MSKSIRNVDCVWNECKCWSLPMHGLGQLRPHGGNHQWSMTANGHPHTTAVQWCSGASLCRVDTAVQSGETDSQNLNSHKSWTTTKQNLAQTLFMLVGCGMTQILWLWLAIHCQYSILRVFILLTLPLAGQWLDTSQPGKWQGHLYCSHFILCTAEHRDSVLLVWQWQCCGMLRGPVSVWCKCPCFHLAGSSELEPGGGARWMEWAGGRAGRGMPGSREGWPGYLHSPAGAASSNCTRAAPASLQGLDWPDGGHICKLYQKLQQWIQCPMVPSVARF